MWIIARSGFLSIVQHRDSPDLMMVRARRREDLVDSFEGLVDEIAEDPKADYRWRLTVPRAAVAEFLLDAIADVDYDSHVKEVTAGDDNERYSAYLDVWSALLRLQTGTPRKAWGRRSWDTAADIGELDVRDQAYYDDLFESIADDEDKPKSIIPDDLVDRLAASNIKPQIDANPEILCANCGEEEGTEEPPRDFRNDGPWCELCIEEWEADE